MKLQNICISAKREYHKSHLFEANLGTTCSVLLISLNPNSFTYRNVKNQFTIWYSHLFIKFRWSERDLHYLVFVSIFFSSHCFIFIRIGCPYFCLFEQFVFPHCILCHFSLDEKSWKKNLLSESMIAPSFHSSLYRKYWAKGKHRAHAKQRGKKGTERE